MLPASTYHPVWFFGIVMAVALAFCPVAAYLSQRSDLRRLLPPFLLVALSVPCLTALAMVYASGDRMLITDFWQRLWLFHIELPYLLFILLLMPVVICLATWISLVFGRSREQFTITDELSAMKGWAILGMAVPLVLAPLLEELGWRGYGVDSLRAYFNLLNTSLLFGVLWSAWHLPAFSIKGYYQNQLWHQGGIYVANFFISVLPTALLMNWIYYKTGRSIPVLVLFHGMLNFSSMILKTDQVTKCIATALLCVIAIIVVLCDQAFFLGTLS